MNVAPRVKGDGNLTPEFVKFTTQADTKTLLNVLRHHWHHLQPRLGSDGIKALKAVMVTCTDQSRRALSSTFVRRVELQMMNDLSFLPLSDPNSEGWDFLKKLGVSLSADSVTYLKLLVQMKTSTTQPKKGEVEEIYRHLEVRFNDGHDSTIK